ncbi:MAG: hypothetical protein JSV52_10220 [Candidatus Zixiibacteriota bacterium]|nr:MAG: hypothetical protein JSV52_10220 [candidate division Zixibacteria bacterium]
MIDTAAIRVAMGWLFVCLLVGSADADAVWREYRLFGEQSRLNRVSRQMTVRVGRVTRPDSTSYIDITLWQGECAMRINLGGGYSPLRLKAERLSDNEAVTLSNERLTHRIYPTPSGVEWEIILLDAPDTNVFCFDMDTRNLSFHRQDSLSALERNELGARRPDSVVGAYVAYHVSNANNRRVISDGDTSYYDFGTGQAFIIYRPRAWDNLDTVWCDLAIDTRQGFLQITVDSEWLDSARYPVTIDPTFGNTEIGASSMSWNLLYGYCHIISGTNTYTVPAGKTATISSYSVYGSETGAGDLPVNMAAFGISDGYPDTRVDEAVSISVSGGTPGWFSSDNVTHQLTSSAEYGVAVGCAPRSGGLIYYNSVTDAVSGDNTNCALGSDTWTQSKVLDFNFSMYATYTEQTVPQTGQDRRRKIVPNRSSQGSKQ